MDTRQGMKNKMDTSKTPLFPKRVFLLSIGVLFNVGLVSCEAAPVETKVSKPASQTISLPEKPGPTNTGPKDKTILKPIAGLTITKDDTVLENVHITGPINVKANNVTIRNFYLDAKDAPYGIRANFEKTGLKFEQGEIVNYSSAAVFGAGFTAIALNVHESGGDGFKVQGKGGPTLIERCWIHHIGKKEGAHADGNQTIGGSDITFRHNFFDLPHDVPAPYKSNACFILQTKTGPITNFLIDSNWLNGGGWTIYAPAKDGTNIQIINNKFGRDYRFGLIVGKDATTFTGNVWEDTGEPLQFNARGNVINPNHKKSVKVVN
jgi:hypothetical protein